MQRCRQAESLLHESMQEKASLESANLSLMRREGEKAGAGAAAAQVMMAPCWPNAYQLLSGGFHCSSLRTWREGEEADAGAVAAQARRRACHSRDLQTAG